MTALLIAWSLLAQVDYAYPLWYEVLDIHTTIARFGPENRYRQGFAQTTRGEHLRLFAAIVQGVHDDPASLGGIRYHDAQGQVLDRLLHRAEILHLGDVARLLDWLRGLGWLCLGAYLALSALLWRRSALPSPLQSARRLLALLTVAGLVVLLVGPKQLFYLFHEWVFPPEHPWFFYYQDSLMTTLMKAPDLFAGIAISLLLLSLPLSLALWGLPWYWQSRRSAQSGRLAISTGASSSAGLKPKIRP